MGIPQRPEFAARDHVGDGERVSPEHVDVLERERRQAGNVGGLHIMAFGAQSVERGVHVDGVPQHHEVDDDAER